MTSNSWIKVTSNQSTYIYCNRP